MRRVALDKKKIVYSLGCGEIQIFWSEIKDIHYDKYDCITEEKGCLVFNDEHGEFIEIFEDTIDWEYLKNNLHLYLPIKQD